MAIGTKKQVEFSLYAPDAKSVCIAGQFNDWDPRSAPMKKRRDGTWTVKMKLPRGPCEYKYLVDGEWMQDARGAEAVPNPFGSNNCVINVH